ncbi:MAG: hypothetical protein A2Z14_16935 [Chloroflexi bacterium RBG_16_48_8]|nr:MAG: hypothetical protein A2Z14_16935 [Chloroflexi bacterium RBG_16_48_8]
MTDSQDLRQVERLKTLFQSWSFVLSNTTIFRRDGDDFEVSEPGFEGSFELVPEGEGTQLQYLVSRDDMPLRTCRKVSTSEACNFHSQTPSDHLGLALEIVFSQPRRATSAASSDVSPIAPEPVIIPTSTVELQAPGAEYASALAALIQAVNERQAAIDSPLTDWGLQGNLQTAINQVQDPLRLAKLIEQEVRSLIGSAHYPMLPVSLQPGCTCWSRRPTALITRRRCEH